MGLGSAAHRLGGVWMQSVRGVKRLIALYYGKMFDKIHCYYLHRKAEFLMFLQQVTQTYACFWVKVLEKAPPPSTPYSLLLSRLTHKSQLPWCAPTASETAKPQSNTQRISHRTRRKPYFSMVLFPLVCMFIFLPCVKLFHKYILVQHSRSSLTHMR